MTPMYEKGRRFATVVNSALGRNFDEILGRGDLQAGSEVDFARQLQKLFAEAQAAWFERGQDELDGKTLRDYLEALSEDELLDFLQGLGEKMDYDFPSSVADRAEKISPAGREAWLKRITDTPPFLEAEENKALPKIYLQRQFLLTAAVWKDPAVSEAILDWFLAAEEPDERTAEAVGLYFRKIGPETAELLGERIRREIAEGRAEKNATDSLLESLTAICRGEEAFREPAYLVLREAFRKMDHKQIPAICLGDLGSLRAIPLLRAHIERYYKTIDRHLYYDIISSILRLGGSTKNLPDPFGDFSDRGIPGIYM